MILQEKLRLYRLLLASHSPRRQQLLRDCGLDYTLIDRYEVEERYPAGLPPHDVPLFLSQLKSDAYPEPLAANDILLTVGFSASRTTATRPSGCCTACRAPSTSSPRA